MRSEQIRAASGFCSNICPSCLSPNDTVCIKCSSSVWSKHSLQHTTEFIYNSDGKIYNDLWGEMSMNMFRNAKKKKKRKRCSLWLQILADNHFVLTFSSKSDWLLNPNRLKTNRKRVSTTFLKVHDQWLSAVIFRFVVQFRINFKRCSSWPHDLKPVNGQTEAVF